MGNDAPVDLFAARREEIDAAVIAGGAEGRFPLVPNKALTGVETATLGELIGAGGYDELSDAMFDELQNADGDESGVIPVPDAIRDALADTDDLDAVAVRWAQTDEVAAWADYVPEFLAGARDLARAARVDGRSLWIWWTL